jgi:predicted nucleotidyltransferase component of viral defense system
LYNSVNEGNVLIFKGGTSLRKIYGLDRYSDDLDFNLNASLVSMPEFIYKLGDRVTSRLLPLYKIRVYVHKNKSGQYNCDTIINDSYGKPTRIAIEMSAAKTYMPPIIKRVITPETTYTASVMNINEILAEKIRAVYTRRNIEDIARDLVDIDFILSIGGTFDPILANKKLAEIKHIRFSHRTFSGRLHLINETTWKKNLSRLMKSVPDRKILTSKILRAIA